MPMVPTGSDMSKQRYTSSEEPSIAANGRCEYKFESSSTINLSKCYSSTDKICLLSKGLNFSQIQNTLTKYLLKGNLKFMAKK